MRLGVHCSVRKGFVGALEEAAALGCQTFQMFTQSPRGWMTRVYADQEFLDFRAAREKHDIFPVVVHAPYLPNLCTSNDDLYAKSLRSLIADLDRCEKLGAEYLVIHPGAFSPESTFDAGIKRLAAALDEAFARVSGASMVLIENMAGGGRRVAGPAKEIAAMLSLIKTQDRVGVCFDTCHALAAGYDISTENGVKATWADYQEEIGLDRIKVFHVNDSKGALGSHRDMHQNLGQGHVGLNGFRALFDQFPYQDRPLILETPKEPMPEADLKNLETLRSILPKAALV